mgnify:CR=1 FL=1
MNKLKRERYFASLRKLLEQVFLRRIHEFFDELCMYYLEKESALAALSFPRFIFS